MSVFRSGCKWLLVGIAALGLVSGADAQSGKKGKQRARRESNAARKARIAHTITETYTHKYEVFGGGGYMRFRSGDTLKKNNEVTFATSGSYYFNPKVAVIAAVGGEYGHAHATVNNIYGVYNPQINEYTFLGGGSYRFYAKEKTALSAQALVGVGWGIFSGGDKGFQSTQLGLYPDGFRPAFSLAVSGDYNFYPNLAVRVSPTYMGTTFGGSVQNNLGFNLGVLYRFGKQ